MATCAARATSGLVTDASANTRPMSPWRGQHAGGPDHRGGGGRDRPVGHGLKASMAAHHFLAM